MTEQAKQHPQFKKDLASMRNAPLLSIHKSYNSCCWLQNEINNYFAPALQTDVHDNDNEDDGKKVKITKITAARKFVLFLCPENIFLVKHQPNLQRWRYLFFIEALSISQRKSSQFPFFILLDSRPTRSRAISGLMAVSRLLQRSGNNIS